jgi:hypothetical protein
MNDEQQPDGGLQRNTKEINMKDYETLNKEDYKVTGGEATKYVTARELRS